jgi:hypothetical protein
MAELGLTDHRFRTSRPEKPKDEFFGD